MISLRRKLVAVSAWKFIFIKYRLVDPTAKSDQKYRSQFQTVSHVFVLLPSLDCTGVYSPGLLSASPRRLRPPLWHCYTALMLHDTPEMLQLTLYKPQTNTRRHKASGRGLSQVVHSELSRTKNNCCWHSLWCRITGWCQQKWNPKTTKPTNPWAALLTVQVLWAQRQSCDLGRKLHFLWPLTAGAAIK